MDFAGVGCFLSQKVGQFERGPLYRALLADSTDSLHPLSHRTCSYETSDDTSAATGGSSQTVAVYQPDGIGTTSGLIHVWMNAITRNSISRVEKRFLQCRANIHTRSGPPHWPQKRS